MGLLPNCGIRLDSARGLSCSSPPRGMRVRRLVVVSPTPRKRFPCCLQVEKPCKRLAVFLHQRASMLANRMAPSKTSMLRRCSELSPTHDRSSRLKSQNRWRPLSRRLRTKSCCGNGGKNRRLGQIQQRLPKFPPNVGRQLWTHLALQRP